MNDFLNFPECIATEQDSGHVSLPVINEHGDLPHGVHRASIDEVIEVFGKSTAQRRKVGQRLCRVYELARATNCLDKAIVFGSFVSAKPDPNDVDLFLLMSDDFDVAALRAEQSIVFDNAVAQAHFGASVFWVRRVAAYPSAVELISGWGIKRGGSVRGIVELAEVNHDSQ